MSDYLPDSFAKIKAKKGYPLPRLFYNEDFTLRPLSELAEKYNKEKVNYPESPFVNFPTPTGSSTILQGVKCFICSNCMRSNSEIASFACGHIYHAFCLLSKTDVKDLCPACISNPHN